MNACNETGKTFETTAPVKTGYAEFVDHMKSCEAQAREMVCSPESTGNRMDDILYEFKALARQKGLSQNATICECVRGLEALDKQLRISISGQKSEDAVAYSIGFTDRADFTSFRNVYVSDGNKETELDNVVVTNNGILILEIKGTKDDITITEDGRIMRGKDACYDNTPIGEKMELKKTLLSGLIQQALAEKGVEIPLNIDTYLVFSAPKGFQYNISDHYKKVKYCRSGKMQFIIRDFTGAVHYSDEQLKVLNEILQELPACQKKFDSEFNPDATIELLADAMKLLREDKAAEVPPVKKEVRAKRRWEELSRIYKAKLHIQRAYAVMASAAVGIFAFPVAGALVGTATGIACAILKKAQ